MIMKREKIQSFEAVHKSQEADVSATGFLEAKPNNQILIIQPSKHFTILNVKTQILMSFLFLFF